MSEDGRVSRNPSEPGKSGPSGAARWADYLDWVREDIIEAVLALPSKEQRDSRLPSGWTPIELLSHVMHMERRWFIWGFLGQPVDRPWGDWNTDEPWRAESGGENPRRARWAVPQETTAEDLAELLRSVGQTTRSVLLGHSLCDAGRVGDRFGSDPPTLEWICFHVLAEYARHAGHLDIVCEMSTADSVEPVTRAGQ